MVEAASLPHGQDCHFALKVKSTKLNLILNRLQSSVSDRKIKWVHRQRNRASVSPVILVVLPELEDSLPFIFVGIVKYDFSVLDPALDLHVLKIRVNIVHSWHRKLWFPMSLKYFIFRLDLLNLHFMVLNQPVPPFD